MRAARRRAASRLGAALIGLALAQCSRAEVPARVLLIGDSITAGMVSEPIGPSYAALLATELGPGFEIVNVACSGSTTLAWRPDAGPRSCPEATGAVRLYAERARPALPADVATILLGTNDVIGRFEAAPVEPEAYRDSLRAIIDALHADGVREVMLLSPPVSTLSALRLARYRPLIGELCQERAFVTCGPDLGELLGPGDFAAGDVHPNGAGHAKIARALAAALRERARG